MKPLTAREVEKHLKAAGFTKDRTEGSHHIWVNDNKGISVSVPHHGNRPLKQWYSGQEAVFDVETMEKIEGELPHRQELIVKGFIAAHLDELRANWKLLNEENGTYFRITD